MTRGAPSVAMHTVQWSCYLTNPLWQEVLLSAACAMHCSARWLAIAGQSTVQPNAYPLGHLPSVKGLALSRATVNSCQVTGVAVSSCCALKPAFVQV